MPFADVDIVIALRFEYLGQHDFRIGHAHIGIGRQVAVQFFMIDGWIRRISIIMCQI